MKQIIYLLAISIIFLAFSMVDSNTSEYTISDDFTMNIKGTSNVHDWVSQVKTLEGNLDISFGEDGSFVITKCEVKIPVESIKSSKGSIMNKKTWNALKSSSNPNISYNLSSFEMVSKSGDNFTASTVGKLTIAGVSETTSIKINGLSKENGIIEITGSKALKMTDFGIDPPTALMGAMTTGDEITIEFRIVLDRNK